MTLTETQRGWLYVGAALIGIAAVVFGVARWEDVQTVITGIVLVLTGGLATKNTLLKGRTANDRTPNDDGLTVVGLVVGVLALIALIVIILLAFDVIHLKG